MIRANWVVATLLVFLLTGFADAQGGRLQDVRDDVRTSSSGSDSSNDSTSNNCDNSSRNSSNDSTGSGGGFFEPVVAWTIFAPILVPLQLLDDGYDVPYSFPSYPYAHTY